MTVDQYIKYVRENPSKLTPQHPSYEGESKKRRKRSYKQELKEADTCHHSCKSEAGGNVHNEEGCDSHSHKESPQDLNCKQNPAVKDTPKEEKTVTETCFNSKEFVYDMLSYSSSVHKSIIAKEKHFKPELKDVMEPAQKIQKSEQTVCPQEVQEA